MLAIFTKPIEAITASDVDRLISEQWPEGYTVEFKKTLPTPKGTPDAWISGGAKIGDFARDEILSEVVAFANAQGGTLVLGIEETKGKPPRASSIAPLPRVGELARRFEDAGRSCIDPPLPRLQVRPIEIQPGEGALIFRTGPSRSAPHRLTTTLEAYKRHGASTVKMTMREIQDMTLNVARGLAGIDKTFDDRRAKYNAWGETARHIWPLASFRVTALPLEGLPDLGRIYDRQQYLFPRLRTYQVEIAQKKTDLFLPFQNYRERPILRGMARVQTVSVWFRQELHQSGLIDLWVALPAKNQAPPGGTIQLELYHGWVLGAVLNVMQVVDLCRTELGAPEAEFGLEVEIGRFSGSPTPLVYAELDLNPFGPERHEVRDSPVLLARIPFGPTTSVSDVLNLIDVDIFDALGVPRPQRTPLSIIK